MKPDAPKFALAPCPFCGGPANYDCANNGTEHGVNCANEFCIGYYMTGAEGQGYYTKHYAVEAWNTRAPISAAPKPDCVGVEVDGALKQLDHIYHGQHGKDHETRRAEYEALRNWIVSQGLLAIKEKA